MNLHSTRLLILFQLFCYIHCDAHEDSSENGVCESIDDEDCNINNNQWTFKSINESLNLLDQEDPILIEEVRKRLIDPSPKNVPYRLETDFRNMKQPSGGQFGQVVHLAELFGEQKGGFFIEAGAFDGEFLSNTLYFEKKMNWRGLLVEPNPDALKTMKGKRRRAYTFGYCLSTKTTPETVEFDACGLIGGIIHNGVKLADEQEFDSVSDYKKTLNRRTIQVQCFPLYSILQALGNPTIDLFSLDIEGAELPVLKTIPWEKVKIRALMVEVNHVGQIFEGTVSDLDSFLDENGFKFYKTVTLDNIYIAKDFKKVD